MDRVLTGRATRIVLLAAGLLATLAAWWWLAGAAVLHPHARPVTLGSVAAAVVMWQAMMVAMMTPTVAPWVGMYARLAGGVPAGGATLASFAFAGGYFTIWLAYSVAAALLQAALTGLGLFGPEGPPALLAGAILLGAGVFQFAPLKQACLTHCRNPMSYLLSAWRDGPPGAFGGTTSCVSGCVRQWTPPDCTNTSRSAGRGGRFFPGWRRRSSSRSATATLSSGDWPNRTGAKTFRKPR